MSIIYNIKSPCGWRQINPSQSPWTELSLWSTYSYVNLSLSVLDLSLEVSHDLAMDKSLGSRSLFPDDT